MARETKRKNAPAMVNSAYLVHLFDIILIKIKKRKKRETDIYFESNSLKILKFAFCYCYNRKIV